ncbi:hypothetical protein Sinac_4476 [Singulisphaera acidiphila DSM 18658]|uniref:Uncharacterized protein n=1 Tax=Singulisphaera acidiphila (strain ATCC BAA-1392 / DSM 18658 / VKM B-2454 / MOB10) TaxID=886293 RepID=L0DH10_SINAD|nr:hypothetical protein Sinac_4476 [Singulisphaera acidiphila DSM 18658]
MIFSNSDLRSGHQVMRLAGRVIVVCILFCSAVFLWKDGMRRGPAPLSQSQYLRHVVEPITIVESMSFDDGGSTGLRFRDAK